MLATLAFSPFEPRKLVFRHYPGRPEKGLLLVGTGSWAQRGDAWLATHDVLHHLPGDTGTVAEEAMTFGAELWLEYPTLGLGGVNASSLEGVLAESYHGSRSLERYVLPETPFEFRLPPARIIERFTDVVAEGLAGAANQFDSHFGEGCRKGLPDEELERFTGSDNQGRFVKWMALGYRAAQRRFPDAVRGRELFGTLRVALDRLPWHEGGVARVCFELDESRYALRGADDMRAMPWAAMTGSSPDAALAPALSPTPNILVSRWLSSRPIGSCESPERDKAAPLEPPCCIQAPSDGACIISSGW